MIQTESQAFKVRRITLVAGQAQPIYPVVVCQDVSVGNATSDDVKLYTTKDDDSTYLVVPTGYERPLSTRRNQFQPDLIAFWLLSAVGGTVILIWS